MTLMWQFVSNYWQWPILIKYLKCYRLLWFKMADETNPRSKLPVADRIREVWWRKLCWWCLSSGFPLSTFLSGWPLAVLFQLGDIQSLWLFLALRSPSRLNAQVEFADNKPAVICPTVCATHSLCHHDILSVLPSHYDLVNNMPEFRVRVHPYCLVASW